MSDITAKNGVTELLADNPDYEGASNQTTNYKLPLYVMGDNFKVLTDQNTAMSIIDQSMFDNASLGVSNGQAITALQNTTSTLSRTLENTNDTVATLSNTLTTLKNRYDTDVPKIKDDLIAQNALIKSLTNRVLALENEHEDIAGEVAGISADVAQLEGYNIPSMQNSLARHEGKLNVIEPKVTYLENTQGVAYYKPVVSSTDTFTKSFEIYNGIRNGEPTKYMITFTCIRLNPIADTPIVVQYLYDSQNQNKILGVTKTHASMAIDDTDKQVSISCTQVAGTDGNTTTITGTVEPMGDQWGVIMSITPVCRD